jgi:hypothetical protein
MYTTTYTFTNPNFDILYFYSQIDNIAPHFNITYSPIDLLTTDTFIFTSDTQQNLDNFISYLNGDTSNY